MRLPRIITSMLSPHATRPPAAVPATRPAARRSARYRVELACDVIGRRHNAPRLMWATDLSAGGIWLEGSEGLQLGETLVLSFQPAIAWRGTTLTLFATVARASAGRRFGDTAPGLGVHFVDLDALERHTLVDWLRPRPLRAAAGSKRRPRRGHRKHFRLAQHPFAARMC